VSEPKVDQPEMLEGAPSIRPYREVGLDIETTNLRANLGHILCAVVKPVGMEPIVLRLDSYKKRELWDDGPLVRDLRTLLAQCSRVFGWYSSRFDIPFIRTRSMLGDLHREAVGFRHCDLYFQERRQLLLHSNRLGVLMDTFSKEQKPMPRPEAWRRAGFGDKAAMDEIVQRCIGDVRGMETVYLQIEPFVQTWSWVSI
jgi:uncharacterized protein YprB with RNaseH-like and TPR domain